MAGVDILDDLTITFELPKRFPTEIVVVWVLPEVLETTTILSFVLADVITAKLEVFWPSIDISYYSGSCVSSDASPVIDDIATKVSYETLSARPPRVALNDAPDPDVEPPVELATASVNEETFRNPAP